MDIKRQTLQHDFAPEWLKLPNQISSAVRSSDQFLNRPVKRDELKDNSCTSRKAVSSSRLESRIQKANGFPNGITSGHHVVSHLGMKLSKSGRNSNQVNGGRNEKTSSNFAQVLPKSMQNCAEPKSFISESETRGINNQGNSSGVLDEIGNRSVSCMDSTAGDTISTSVDEEFPSLIGDTADCSKPSFSRVLSVWDGISRECNAVSRTNTVGERVISVKSPPHKSGAGKRAASDVELQASNGKTVTGQRPHSQRMTVLSASKDRQKEQPPLSLMTSVSKVITRELEDRKSNYMKLVRRESHECNGDGIRTEPCDNSSIITVHQDPVGITDGQKLCHGDVENQDMASSTASTESVMAFSDEDERRLLCSMGWEECKDEENYELTEAEIAEVINMIKEKQKLNGHMEQANGCSKFHHVQKFTFDNHSRPQSTTIH